MTPATVQTQMAALVAQYGESVALDRGGVTRAVRGLFAPANGVVVATYFDDNAAVGLVRPCVQAFFDATVSGTAGTLGPPQINDTFTRDGRPFTIQKVQMHRLGDTVVLIAALCS